MTCTTDKCTGCGKPWKFCQVRMSPAIQVHAPIERLCDDCVILWDAVATRPFFVKAQNEYFEENKFMAAYKADMLGQAPPPKGGFAV